MYVLHCVICLPHLPQNDYEKQKNVHSSAWHKARLEARRNGLSEAEVKVSKTIHNVTIMCLHIAIEFIWLHSSGCVHLVAFIWWLHFACTSIPVSTVVVYDCEGESDTTCSSNKFTMCMLQAFAKSEAKKAVDAFVRDHST